MVRATADTAVQYVHPAEVKTLINDKGFGRYMPLVNSMARVAIGAALQMAVALCTFLEFVAQPTSYRKCKCEGWH